MGYAATVRFTVLIPPPSPREDGFNKLTIDLQNFSVKKPDMVQIFEWSTINGTYSLKEWVLTINFSALTGIDPTNGMPLDLIFTYNDTVELSLV